MSTKRIKVLIVAVLAVVVVALPLVMGHGSTTMFVNLLLAAVVTTGLTVLMGYAGQVSLGQGAFFAIGALGTGLMASGGLPPLAALVAGVAIAGGFAVMVGWPLLRLRGNYLAFGTLALQVIVLTVVANVALFGGPSGIQNIPHFGIGPLEIKTPTGYAYLALVTLGIVLLASYRIVNSRFGRGLRALSGSESAAESAGVPVFSYKIQVFAHSAMVAALAGGVYAFFIGYVSASSFSIMISFQYVVMAVVGGVTSLWGGLVGAAIISILLQILNVVGTMPGMPATAPAILSYAVYAIVLIATLLFLPRGIAPSLGTFIERITAGRAKSKRTPTIQSAADSDLNASGHNAVNENTIKSTV